MSVVHLAHGIREWTPGSQMRPLHDWLEQRNVPVRYLNYGYVLIPITNKNAVNTIIEQVGPNDDLAAYSNACWGWHQAAELGLQCRHVHLISPALNVNAQFPPGCAETITIYFSPGDRATQAGRVWRRATRVLPWRWRNPHGWGAMGREGSDAEATDARVRNVRLLKRSRHAWYECEYSVDEIGGRLFSGYDPA